MARQRLERAPGELEDLVDGAPSGRVEADRNLLAGLRAGQAGSDQCLGDQPTGLLEGLQTGGIEQRVELEAVRSRYVQAGPVLPDGWQVAAHGLSHQLDVRLGSTGAQRQGRYGRID